MTHNGAASPAPDHTRRGGPGSEDPGGSYRESSSEDVRTRPGDMVQDDDGWIYIHCADGLMRLADADTDPYTLAELDAERGPLLPLRKDA